MEVRGEMRGEGCCFMQAMRAIYNSIRDRLRPRRTRQRNKKYRICRNSAMANTKKKNPRKHLTSGLNSRAFISHVANVETAPRGRKKEDGVHGELQEKLRSTLRASQERRKPRWVLQIGSQQNSLAHVRMEETQAEHLQPAPKHEISNTEDAQTKDLEPVEPRHEIMKMEEVQAKVEYQLDEPINENVEEAWAGEDFQPAEPAIWVAAHAQMWQEMTKPDPVSWCKMPFMYSGPGSKFPVPPEWDLDHLMELWRSAENNVGEEQETANEATNLEDTKAGEYFQPGELDIQLDEETSWVVAHAKMWREMTEPDPVSWCNMPIMYSGLGSKYPVPPEWDLEHLMEVWRSSENKEEGEQGRLRSVNLDE